MAVSDGLSDGKAKPRAIGVFAAGGVGAEERFAEPRELVGRHAWAFVNHAHVNFASKSTC